MKFIKSPLMQNFPFVSFPESSKWWQTSRAALWTSFWKLQKMGFTAKYHINQVKYISKNYLKSYSHIPKLFFVNISYPRSLPLKFLGSKKPCGHVRQRLFEDIEVRPSLLHGDFWSGNVAVVEDRPAVFDPAAYYGHHEARP